MTHTKITYAYDRALTVYVNFEQASSPVFYVYDRDDGDEPERQSTPLQGADMPRDEQAAAKMVSEWIDESYGA